MIPVRILRFMSKILSDLTVCHINNILDQEAFSNNDVIIMFYDTVFYQKIFNSRCHNIFFLFGFLISFKIYAKQVFGNTKTNQ